MSEGTPIVTSSAEQVRAFRLRPWTCEGKRDLPPKEGTAFVVPCSTNVKWAHEVPASKRLTGKRVSIALRGSTVADGEAGD